MKFFVTGAGGFIGSHVIRSLLGSGHEVAFLRRSGSNSSRLGGLNLTPIDVLDQLSCFSQTEQRTLSTFAPDAVIHLGWIGVGNFERNSLSQLENVEMSVNILRASAEAGARHFVGFGSQAEYGPCEGAIDEKQPLNPTTVYGASKASVGLITGVLAEQLGLQFSWIRVFSTYGPGDEPYWMIQDVAKKLLDGEIPQLTLGTQQWDYLFVEDAARAITKVAESSTGLGQINLGSGRAPTIREIVETLRDVAAPQLTLSFGAVPFRDDQVMHLEANISKLQKETGWVPEVSLFEGLTSTVQYLRESR